MRCFTIHVGILIASYNHTVVVIRPVMSMKRSNIPDGFVTAMEILNKIQNDSPSNRSTDPDHLSFIKNLCIPNVPKKNHMIHRLAFLDSFMLALKCGLDLVWILRRIRWGNRIKYFFCAFLFFV